MREPFLERRGCCCTRHVPLLGRGRAAVVADRCGQGPRLEMRAGSHQEIGIRDVMGEEGGVKKPSAGVGWKRL